MIKRKKSGTAHKKSSPTKSVQIAVSGAKRRRKHTAHAAPQKRHTRRKISGLDNSVLQTVAYGVAGGLIGRVLNHTLQNSTTLNLKPKDSTKTDYTPYIIPAISAIAAMYVKNPMVKKLATGAAIVSIAEIVNESKLPQLISGVPQTVGYLPQTVGAPQRRYTPIARRIKQNPTMMLNGAEPDAGNRGTDLPMMFGGNAGIGAVYANY
jgi:hypothetical protein